MSDNKSDDEKKSASWNFSVDKSTLTIDEKKRLAEEQAKKKGIATIKEKKLRLDFKAVPKQVSRTQMAKDEDNQIEKEMEADSFFNRVIKPNLAPMIIFVGALVAMILYKKFK